MKRFEKRTAVMQAWQGFINTPHYAASKLGLVGFTRSLAKELAVDNNTVSAFRPGINVDGGLNMS
jgi:meso-butanediol dehydrogenase / (S,S)-butanediol dehydrogenase / diacetyl reductase